jgi:hypothetical protein
MAGLLSAFLIAMLTIAYHSNQIPEFDDLQHDVERLSAILERM